MRTVHFFKHVLLLPVVIAGFGAIVMLLWNWLVPSIFGWAAIDYWQALGLWILVRIFSGGFGRRRLRAGMGHGHHHGNHLHEKWQKMTPEKRKEFVKKHCRDMNRGFGHHFGDHFTHYDETGKPDEQESPETK